MNCLPHLPLRWFATRLSINVNTEYRSPCCLHCMSGFVLSSNLDLSSQHASISSPRSKTNVFMTVMTLSLSNLPSFSKASKPVAQCPRPSAPFSTRESMKSLSNSPLRAVESENIHSMHNGSAEAPTRALLIALTYSAVWKGVLVAWRPRPLRDIPWLDT